MYTSVCVCTVRGRPSGWLRMRVCVCVYERRGEGHTGWIWCSRRRGDQMSVRVGSVCHQCITLCLVIMTTASRCAFPASPTTVNTQHTHERLWSCLDCIMCLVRRMHVHTHMTVCDFVSLPSALVVVVCVRQSRRQCVWVLLEKWILYTDIPFPH